MTPEEHELIIDQINGLSPPQHITLLRILYAEVRLASLTKIEEQTGIHQSMLYRYKNMQPSTPTRRRAVLAIFSALETLPVEVRHAYLRELAIVDPQIREIAGYEGPRGKG